MRSQPGGQSTQPLAHDLVVGDRLFRVAGIIAVALLLTTIALGVAEIAAWRWAFTAAHVAALVALAPLGVALVRHGMRQAAAGGNPGWSGVLRHYRGTALLMVVALVAVAVSLVNFEDGSRAARRLANYTTVVIALALIVRYLRWRRSAL